MSIGTGFYWGDLFESHDINNYYFEGAIPKLRPNFKDTSDTADIFQPEAQRTSFFIFAQDEWLINPNWELTSGLRYDHYSDFGDTVNPRLALVWHTHSTLTTKLLYGRAFRAPAFLELYGKNNPVALGNPNLSPEVLTSKELAFAWRPSKKLHIDWNFYQFHIHDYIDFVNDAGQQTFSAQNVGRIVGQGFETEWRYQGLNQIQILFNYSHQDTKNKNTHQPQGGVPVDKFYIRGLWDIPLGWQVSGQLTREGKSKRSAGDDREALAAYTTLDVNIRHVWSNDYESSLTVRNVFDADIKEASRGPSPNQTKASLSDDVPQQGRSISVNLKLNW
ncbi:TonB-dependent receptor plug domain-containing protein [Agitococcus lubricus]|uniref:TonB-dependent receptor-like protein n=1 Tax=Agitococcus lubricus TaxID=1077255 RepID=A0A2T5J005_9GAMM|nr:TonB-dependent receptor [Agitococcus lubricus]PTQ89678.1 TonB-dependent receptor-like protein [Agitococcus lubricus]